MRLTNNLGSGHFLRFWNGGVDNQFVLDYDGTLSWPNGGAAPQNTVNNLPVFGALTKGVVPAAGAVPSADNYLRETGAFASLAADVRAVVLTGLSLASSAAVAATDTILAAFGKLQAFNDLFTTVGLAIARLANPSAVTFLRMNADNTATARTAAEMRTDLGLGTAAVVNTGTTTGTVSLVENLYLFTASALPLVPITNSLVAPNTYVWTNQPAALTWFQGVARWVAPVSLIGRKQAKVNVFMPTGGTVTAGSKIRLLYRTQAAGYDVTIGNWNQLGSAADVEVVVVATVGVYSSAWIDLATLAKDDVIIAVAGIAGNGADDPQYVGVSIEYR